MSTNTQRISAYISKETKAQVEAYARRHGVKKAYLIEQALQHHLQALREIPEDAIIPARLGLTREAMAMVAESDAQQTKPPEALKTLFRA